MLADGSPIGEKGGDSSLLPCPRWALNDWKWEFTSPLDCLLLLSIESMPGWQCVAFADFLSTHWSTVIELAIN